jgi:two-component system, NtrC family, sensor kinase
MDPDLTTAAAPAVLDIAGLRLDVAPVLAGTCVNDAAGLFLLSAHAKLLCLPIVAEGRVLGTLSRHALNNVFLRRFGRELIGGKPVTAISNNRPLVVRIDTPLEAAVAYVSQHVDTPLTEDFVIVDQNGRYLGMGVVLDLLAALRARVQQGAVKLAGAYGQLKRSQTALVQSEKMASLGQMVAGVAHEINTPLGYVRNNVEMMRGLFDDLRSGLQEYQTLGRMLVSDTVDEAALGAQLARIESVSTEDEMALLEDAAAMFDDTLFGVDQIRDLVVNLRNFSRLDQARVSAVSLNDCIEQTLMIANNVLKNRVEVIRRLGDVPAVECSPSQINQVLLNLITNAAQAVAEHGGKILLKSEADTEWVRVSVQDNGGGIAPEHLKKIFDPFFTTKPVGQGTGLGLSISYQIVEAHGGRLEVASKLGVGTRFQLTLPRISRVQAQIDADEPQAAVAA